LSKNFSGQNYLNLHNNNKNNEMKQNIIMAFHVNDNYLLVDS